MIPRLLTLTLVLVAGCAPQAGLRAEIDALKMTQAQQAVTIEAERRRLNINTVFLNKLIEVSPDAQKAMQEMQGTTPKAKE